MSLFVCYTLACALKVIFLFSLTFSAQLIIPDG